MTYQSYSKGIMRTLSVLGLLFFTQQIGRYLFVHLGVPFLFTINYLALRIAVIFLLFFSIYALLARIERVRKLESPIVFIVISVLFVFLSYGPPIAFYVISHDIQNPYTHSQLSVNVIKKEVVNINNMSGKRYRLAEDYYFDTGERLPWLDENNKITLYTPDDKAMARLKLRQSLMESYRMLDVSRAKLRITALSLIGILVISTICFIGFLWHRPPRNQRYNVP